MATTGQICSFQSDVQTAIPVTFERIQLAISSSTQATACAEIR